MEAAANPYASPTVPPEQPTLVATVQRPLTLLGVLGDGTSLYLRRFPTLAAVTLAIWGPLEACISYVEYHALAPDDFLGAIRLSTMADNLIGIIAVGGVISVAEAALRGEYRGWLAGLGTGLRLWPWLFATRFVAGCLMLLAALALVLPALYVMTRLALLDQIVVLEGRSARNAVNRGFQLSRGRFWTFLGLYMITVPAIMVVGSAVITPLVFFPEYDHWLLSAALTCISDLLATWLIVVFVVAYFQCRGEEQRAQQLANAAAQDSESVDSSPADATART